MTLSGNRNNEYSKNYNPNENKNHNSQKQKSQRPQEDNCKCDDNIKYDDRCSYDCDNDFRGQVHKECSSSKHHNHCEHDKKSVCCDCNIVDEKCPSKGLKGCCMGVGCELDRNNIQNIPVYLNVIFDETCAPGSPLSASVTTTPQTYEIVQRFQPFKGCCTDCLLDDSSIFEIDSIDVCVEMIPVNPLTISGSQVLVNGIPSPAPIDTERTDLYRAEIDPGVTNSNCEEKCLGTKSSVLLDSIAGWTAIMRYDICGIVSTCGSTCKFFLSYKNLYTIPQTLTGTSTFIVDPICIPDFGPGQSPTLDFTFTAKAQIVNPVLTADGCSPPTLTGTVYVTPIVNMEVTKNQRACIRGSLI